MRISLEVADSRPAIMRMVVFLLQPEVPSRTRNSVKDLQGEAIDASEAGP